MNHPYHSSLSHHHHRRHLSLTVDFLILQIGDGAAKNLLHFTKFVYIAGHKHKTTRHCEIYQYDNNFVTKDESWMLIIVCQRSKMDSITNHHHHHGRMSPWSPSPHLVMAVLSYHHHHCRPSHNGHPVSVSHCVAVRDASPIDSIVLSSPHSISSNVFIFVILCDFHHDES